MSINSCNNCNNRNIASRRLTRMELAKLLAIMLTACDKLSMEDRDNSIPPILLPTECLVVDCPDILPLLRV